MITKIVNEPRLTEKFGKISKQKPVEKVHDYKFVPENMYEILQAKKEIREFVSEFVNVVHCRKLVHHYLQGTGVEPMTDHGFLNFGLYRKEVPLNFALYLCNQDLSKGSHKLIHRKRMHIQMFIQVIQEAIDFIPTLCKLLQEDNSYIKNLYELHTQGFASPKNKQFERDEFEEILLLDYRGAHIFLRCLNMSRLFNGTRTITTILKCYSRTGSSETNNAAINQILQFHSKYSNWFSEKAKLASTF